MTWHDDAPFRLDDSFIARYAGKQPLWGPIGYVTYKRTYARSRDSVPERIIDLGQRFGVWDLGGASGAASEEFWLTLVRVTEGTYRIQQQHCIKHRLPWSNERAQRSAHDFFDRMWTFKWLPPGRGLWMMGTDYVDRCGGAALNNCAFASTDRLDILFSAPFTFLMDMSMLGVGVGGDTKGAGSVRIQMPATDVEPYVVADSREGWVELVRRTLDAYVGVGALPVNVDYSQIRPIGSPIKGFGGTAAGASPLLELYNTIRDILGPLVGRKITSTAIVDLFNVIGRCVVAGNIRRSAEIMFGEPGDSVFLKLKDPTQISALEEQHRQAVAAGVRAEVSAAIAARIAAHPLKAWRWASNNTQLAVVGMDYAEPAELTAKNGEPGYMWLENARAYGRMTDPPNNRDHRAAGGNPCVPAGTLVLTREGYRSIENLVGMRVQIWNGAQWSYVEPRVTGRNERMVRVRLSDGTSLTCTEYHEWLTTEGRRRAVDLMPGDALEKVSMPLVESGVPFTHAYTHGFFCGDGQVSESGSKGALLCGEKMRLVEHLEGQTTGEVDEYGRLWFGMPRTMAEKFVVPLDATVCDRIAWFAGLLDADGCVVRNLHSVGLQMTSVNLDFLLRVRLMLTTLGVQAKVTSRDGSAWTREMPDGRGGVKSYERQQLYLLSVNATDTYNLRRMGLATRRLDVPLAKPQRDARRFVTVEEIDRLGFADVVYCFNEPFRHAGCFDGIVTGQCLEQTLESFETCCLVETFPSLHDSYQDYERTLKKAYMYAKTVTLVPTHDERTNAVMLRNRRIGCSMSGIVQAMNRHGRRSFLKDWCNRGYAYLTELDNMYSDWLCVPHSIKITSVKPSGTVSLLPGVTPGIHFPHDAYYFRVIRFDTASPLVRILRAAGYRCEEIDPRKEPNTTAVYFAVAEPFFARGKRDVSMWEQLEMAAQMQAYWADNQVSCTVTFQAHEAKDIKHALELYETRLKGISFLPFMDEADQYKSRGFEHVPYQAIDRVTYEDYVAKLQPLDLNSVRAEVVDKFCDGPICDLPQKAGITS